MAAVDESPRQCLDSGFVIDSPLHSDSTSVGAGAHSFLPVEGYASESDAITVDGCPAQRYMALVPTPGHSGKLEDPVPGKVPAVVLVRIAEVPRADDGSCPIHVPVPSCADQFVVRVKDE